MDNLSDKYDLEKKIDSFIGNYRKRLVEEGFSMKNGGMNAPEILWQFINSKAIYSECKWKKNLSGVFDGNYLKDDKSFNWGIFKDVTEISVLPLLRSESDEKEVNRNVLYGIIQRGWNVFGPRRGILFSEEFGLDVNIPVSYSIDFKDKYLYSFLKPLLPKLNLETLCPLNYFSSDSSKIQEIYLGEAIDFLKNSNN